MSEENLPAAAESNLPAIIDFSQDASLGFDEVKPEDFGIPIVRVLQKMSSAVDEREGAKAGDFYISSSDQLFSGSEGLQVIPSYYKKIWAIWTPRDLGGGYQGELAFNDPIALEAKEVGNKRVLENGDELVETVQWYLTILNDGINMRVLFPMSSTQLRVSRKFISLSAGIKLKNSEGDLYTPPMFSHVYRMNTVLESNTKGSWYSMNLSVVGPVQEAGLYQNAREFYEMMKA